MKSLSFTLAILLGMLAVAQATDLKKDAKGAQSEIVAEATAEEGSKDGQRVEVVDTTAEESASTSDKK